MQYHCKRLIRAWIPRLGLCIVKRSSLLLTMFIVAKILSWRGRFFRSLGSNRMTKNAPSKDCEKSIKSDSSSLSFLKRWLFQTGSKQSFFLDVRKFVENFDYLFTYNTCFCTLILQMGN